MITNFRNKRVLLTGHTGFKGTWFSVLLQKLGANITGYSNCVSSTSFYSKIGKFHNGNDIFGDIVDMEKLTNCISEAAPEIIFHFAAQPLVSEGYNDPYQTFMVNTVGTLNVIEAVRRLKLKIPIILITTDKVYRNREIKQVRYEETEVLWGNDPYAASKVAAEQVAWSYGKSIFDSSDFKLAVVRAGNVIGGGDFSLNRIVPDFLDALNKDESLDIRSPNAIRPWQHVLEPLWGYAQLGSAILSDNDFSSYSNWNFGPEAADVISVKELVTSLNQLSGDKVRINFDSETIFHESSFLDLDSAKAKQQLDWKPIWEIEQTLCKILKWNDAYRLSETNAWAITDSQVEDYLNSL